MTSSDSLLEKFKYLFKNIGILTVGNFSSKILIFFLVPLYTNVLTTDEYGIYDLAYTLIQLLCPLLTANISAAVLRFMLDENSDKKIVFSRGIRWILFSTLIFGVMIFGVTRLGLFSIIRNYIGLTVCLYVLYSLNQFFLSYAKGLEKLRVVAVAGVLSSVVMISANIVFLLIIKIGLRGFFLANILALTTTTLYYAIMLPLPVKDFFTKNNDDSLHKKMLAYSLPLIAVEIGWWCNNASDRVIVAALCGTSATGLLAVSYKIPSIMNVIQQTFIQAWHISGIKEYEEGGENSFFCEAFNCLSFALAFSSSVLIGLSDFLGKLLFAKDFYNAWVYSPFLIISSFINAMAGYIGTVLAAKKDSVRMGLSGIIGAVANVILNVILVLLIGIQGATISTAISSLLIFAIRYSGAKEIIEDKNIIMFITSVVLLCIQTLCAIYWMPVIQIIIFAGLLFLYRKLIYRIIRARGKIFF